jgi:predicted transposase YbfD/YdcC
LEKAHTLFEHFSIISDPRLDRKKKHKLIDIIVLSICGVICSCKTWVDIAEYGRSKLDWFQQFLELPNGIPSHDTFGRVFSILDPIEFQKAFQDWVADTFPVPEGEIISLDGKYFKASYREAGRSRSVLGMVSAWASEAGISLAHKKADFDKEGEKRIYCELIKALNLKGHTVTMDAYGCHAFITNRIVEKGGDFLVGLKSNQKTMLNQMRDLLANENGTDSFETMEKSHGRIERRFCQAKAVPESIVTMTNKKVHREYRPGHEEWNGLRSVCKITSERTLNGKKTIEDRYYISSLEPNAEKMLHTVRSHWGIENKLHYVLDVAFMEDQCRVRNGDAGENFAVLRRLALNLLRAEKTSGRSINGKSLKAGWSDDYLVKIIMGTVGQELVV